MRSAALLIATLTSPAAIAGGLATVCPGPSTWAGGSVQTCEYPGIVEALAAGETTIDVYVPDDVQQRDYAPITINRGVSIRGIADAGGVPPRIAATADNYGVLIDCACSASLDGLEIDATDNVGLRMGGGTINLTDVHLLGNSTSDTSAWAAQIYDGQLIASGGGLTSVRQALYIDGGTVTWDDGLFQSVMGPVALIGSGQLELSGGTAYSPGSMAGLQLDGGSLSLLGGFEITGVSADGQLGRTANSLVRVGNGSLYANNATLSEGAGYQGALIDALASVQGSVSLENCLLTDADVTNDGALLHAAGVSSVTSTGTTWRNGTAASGGGVKLVNVGWASFTGDTFIGNSAEGELDSVGGGLAAWGTPLAVTNTLFTSNVADESGGALFYGGDSGTLTLDSSTIRHSTSGGPGAGVYASRPVNVIDSFFQNNWGGSGAAVRVDNTTWSDNGSTYSTNYAGADVNSSSGGAIYADGLAAVTLTDTDFLDNTAAFEGGALGGHADSSYTVAGSRFWRNQAVHAGGAMSTPTAGTGSVTRSVFCENTASHGGGAIYAFIGQSSGGSENWSHLVFHDNAVDDYGGAVFADGGLITIDNATLTGNEAVYGGGLYADGGGSIDLTNSLLAHTAGGYGADVGELDQPNLSIQGGAFANLPSTAAAGVTNSMVELGSAPFVSVSPMSCAQLDWGTQQPYGATTGTTPFVPPTTAGDLDGDGYTVDQGDCDDSDPNRSPGRYEICDGGGVDEDCDGLADDADLEGTDGGELVFFVDADGDGFGAGQTGSFCELPSSGWAAEPGDCNDADPAIHPDADELCDGKGVDEDCDGLFNESSAIDATTLYPDIDNDGFGGEAAVTGCPAAGFVANNADCNDRDATINPDANETCDDQDTDEDCNGLADDADSGNVRGGMSTYYADDDLDGYTGSRTVNRCDPSTQFLAEPTELDCNDADPDISPGDPEICDPDDVDENCNGTADDADSELSDGTYWYTDGDADGFGAEGDSTYGCGGDGLADNSQDCNDGDHNIHPDADEICDDLNTDEDCDGLINDADNSLVGALSWYVDADGDSYGDASGTEVVGCAADGRVANADDCDDGDATVNPEGTEDWVDDVDEDCDGNWTDQDGDSYPNAAVAQPGELVDCDDDDPDIHPGATDTPGDGTDQDCSGEDAQSYVGGSCGCSNQGAPGLWLALPGLLLLRRRR